MRIPKFRLIAASYISLLFVVFLFVFVRAEQSAAPDTMIASSMITATMLPSETPTPSPTATATPTPIPVAQPARLVVPRLNLDVAIESRGNDATGHMDVPSWHNSAWYNLGPRPGEPGSAVIAGHYDTNTGDPAIFYYMSQLQAGDDINVVDETNKMLTFKVTDVRTYAYDLFPVDEVFNDPSGRKLNLITCSGMWNHILQTYSDRLVVFTDLQ